VLALLLVFVLLCDIVGPGGVVGIAYAYGVGVVDYVDRVDGIIVACGVGAGGMTVAMIGGADVADSVLVIIVGGVVGVGCGYDRYVGDVCDVGATVVVGVGVVVDVVICIGGAGTCYVGCVGCAVIVIAFMRGVTDGVVGGVGVVDGGNDVVVDVGVDVDVVVYCVVVVASYGIAGCSVDTAVMYAFGVGSGVVDGVSGVVRVVGYGMLMLILRVLLVYDVIVRVYMCAFFFALLDCRWLCCCVLR